MSTVKKFTDQFRYTGLAPLDARNNPVETVSELPTARNSYEGQMVVVLDDEGEQRLWWFKAGKWERYEGEAGEGAMYWEDGGNEEWKDNGITV